ncbi:DNA methyltransferase [Neobacillus mesonae]|uniref:DNA methyltransferase n=1 Tax=Neobacillus mesonae TaxID=1193713 RepID=UPI0025740481|nr:DNA methyltransferase [Neobacillus mesonae]
MTNNEQLSFKVTEVDNKPVVCLGMTFENEEARREFFREELRKKLPELKQIEGFPIGEDEDIIALSDPPYYTACPNPWINDIISEWQLLSNNKDNYNREPLAIDITEGKSDAAYMAHAYHTKVPSKAIAQYVQHYTEPGDIILDGFSGSGMTGVGVQLADEIEKVTLDRKIVLNDLSTVATHISKMYNSPQNVEEFIKISEKILNKVVNEYSWMFETTHPGVENSKGKINYIIWSEVFSCPECAENLEYWNIAVNEESNSFNEKFKCTNCGSDLEKKNLDKVFETFYDDVINENIRTVKHIPIRINYSFQGKRYEKPLDKRDLEQLAKIDNIKLSKFIPSVPLPKGDEIERLIKSYGYTHTHHLYTKRSLVILSVILEEISKYNNRLLLGWFTSALLRTTKMYKFTLNRKMGTVSGTYYIPSLWVENFPDKLLKRKLNDLSKVSYPEGYNAVINTGTQTNLLINENSIDYIFTDPPFGENLMYSELNFVWESWLGVLTNNDTEAIMNKSQNKGLEEYHSLMFDCFKSYYKVLKPSHWITVVFSNSKADVWNVIQEAIQRAGFVIANVSALDKKQGSFKAVTTTTAVKQDLVISAYKPSEESISQIHQQTNTPESAWIFITQHLEKLPIFLGSKGEASVIAERTPRILFDRMVAYHVQNGLPVPISSAEFQAGVAQRFPMRDGMAFLESQVAEYDKKRTLVKEFSQMSLFVSDENSAIEWIRQQLMKKPQTRQDLHPQFMKEIQHIAKHEQLPELDDLLAQNFLRYEGEETVPDQIASYLRRNFHDMRGLENTDGKLRAKAMNRWYVPDPNKQADLEKLREKTLLREFDHYVEELGNSKKKLKQFRTEAIRAGFKKAWSEKNYEKIVTVGDRLPEQVIQEDDKLLMYYDNAQVRLDM